MKIGNKTKFTVVVALVASIFAAGYPAVARYDELIIPNKINSSYKAISRDLSNEMYMVKNGDSLWQLSGRYGLTVEELRSLNGLARESNLILAGQRLRVFLEEPVIHSVKRGETLIGIASDYHVTVSDLTEKNEISDVNQLYEGQELVVLSNRDISAKGVTKQAAQAVQQVSRNIPLGGFIWPVQGLISSMFGMRDGRPHQGMDIAANEGTTIRAAKKGRVVFAGPRGTYGLAVIIEHGGGVQTLYGHCSKLLVSEGEDVSIGQSIAQVGSTGRSTGPHLHFEVISQGVHYDPLPFLNKNYG